MLIEVIGILVVASMSFNSWQLRQLRQSIDQVEKNVDRTNKAYIPALAKRIVNGTSLIQKSNSSLTQFVAQALSSITKKP